MKKFIVDFNSNLKDFTDSHYPQASFIINRLLKEKEIKVNGVKVGENVELKMGDEVSYYLSKKDEEKESHKVIYEDERVIVCDKMQGVSSEGLAYELKEKGARLVHRLDRNTAGVIILPKNDRDELAFKKAFENKEIKKTYLCICKNNFKKKHDYMKDFLFKDENKSYVKISSMQESGYVLIETEYSVLKYNGDYALVEVSLHTGKTHQIRAHMAYIHCPVLGDEKYGDEDFNSKYKVKRQLLVAKKIEVKCKEIDNLYGKIFESSFYPTLKNV